MLAGLCLLAGCSTNPTTGRSQFTTMSYAEEKAIGEQAAPELIREFGGEAENAALRAYVAEVGNKLKDQTEVDGPQRAWEFTLLESDVINAFALPGEKVFISRGLADKMTNEAQLAGVLGHEIGHVMARHGNERISQATYIGIGSQVLGAVAGAVVKDPTLGQALPAIATQGGQLVVLKFSRSQETEADTLGMRYMSKAGYNPRGQLQVMEILKSASGGEHPPEFLATHPLPDTRIRDVQNLLVSEYAAAEGEFFEARFRQRYLREAGVAAPKKQKEPKRNAAVDRQGRERMLAGIVLEDPTSWCSVCRVNAGHGGH